jgi:drug/metabolite transporter (DMT)-like permease
VIETGPFLAVLLSALLHAAWNAVVRASPEPGEVMAACVIAAGFVSLPGVLWFGLPPAVSWPYLLAGMALNTAAIRFAMAAYRTGSFGLTYPVMRAGIPLLALPIGAVIIGEWPRPVPALGVVLIASGVILLALNARGAAQGELRALGFALLAALAAAGYVTLDALGVRGSGNVAGYAFTLAVLNAGMIAAVTRLEGRDPAAILRRHARLGFAISIGSMASFLLYIWAVSVSPVALAAALRETSVIFAMGLAAFALKERIGPLHWLAAVLALVGVLAIRLG